MSTGVVTGKYPAYLMTIRTTGFRGIEKSTAMPVNLSAGRDRVIANENCKMDVMRVFGNVGPRRIFKSFRYSFSES